MSDSLHQQLLGHLLAALDDDEQAWMDQRLEHDEESRTELARWRRRLAPLEALRPDFDPPPGLAGRTCRMVAAYGPVPARSALPRAAMTPDPTAPGAASQFGWYDVAAIGVLLLTAFTVILPAIDASRFQSAVAFCQNRMRQFGLAMTEYGHRHGEELPQLAGGGQLTAAGIAAADLLGLDAAGDADRQLCPETWLAAQDADRPWNCLESLHVSPPSPGTSVPGYFFTSASSTDWPYILPNGMNGAADNSAPDLEAMFADDIGEPRGRRLTGHRCRGRNLFFGNGRVGFVPCSTTIEEPAESDFYNVDYVPPADDVSVPVIFVNRSGQ